MTEDHFGPEVAARYDDDRDSRFGHEHLALEVGFLADLAGAGGSALEFAVGTGRVALPLSARGVQVSGIDLSSAMLDRLRVKPGATDVRTVQGDMTQVRVPGQFDLVYLVFNTIGNVTSQHGQAAVFRNAARHLRPGGSFVVETGVPNVRRLGSERYVVFSHTDEHLGLDEYDTGSQAMWSHHYHREPDGRYRRTTVPFRYAWPAELDLMAQAVDLRLRERWAWWDRFPFTEASPSHVSVWELTDPRP